MLHDVNFLHLGHDKLIPCVLDPAGLILCISKNKINGCGHTSLSRDTHAQNLLSQVIRDAIGRRATRSFAWLSVLSAGETWIECGLI